MGLSAKCFEILENRPSNYDLRHDGINVGDGAVSYAVHDPMLSDEESEMTEDEDEDEEMEGEEVESESEEDEGEVSEEESEGEEKGPKLRVREILFYEERVEAYRRRHGMLRP